MRLFLSLLLLATALAAQVPVPASPQKSAAFEGLDASVASLSEITGLARLKKVQYDTISREGLKAFIEERIKEEIKPEDIRIDEMSLKRFGFVPEEFDLKGTTIALLTEQAAAFYDYRKKKLFLLSGDSLSDTLQGDAAKTVVVHELAHALADQHFDLGKYIKHGRTDDGSTARAAVMEGQATWLMLESMAQKAGMTITDKPEMLDLMSAGANEAMASQFPVLATAPLYIRASLIFPYNQGLKFQHALVQKLGKAAFSKVYKEPPASTQQIYHPEMYIEGFKPETVKLPVLARSKDWKTLTEGTVGEFDHAILLEQYVNADAAKEIAPAWRGGTFGLAEHKSGKHVALLYSANWKDEASAKKMFEAWARVLKGKNKKLDFTEQSDRVMAGAGDHGLFRVVLTGRTLTAIEGLKTADEFPRQID